MSMSVRAMEWVNSACTSSLTHSSFLRTKETAEVMQKQPDILHTQSFLLYRIHAHPFLKHIYWTFYLLNDGFTMCQETSYLPYEHYFCFYLCAFIRNCMVRGCMHPNILVSLWLYLIFKIIWRSIICSILRKQRKQFYKENMNALAPFKSLLPR